MLSLFSFVFFSLFLCSSFVSVFSLYLPGVVPQTYKAGDEVEVKLNKLDSVKTQLSYSYYSLPFPHPGRVESSIDGLGEVLSGDLMENSLYKLIVQETHSCRLLGLSHLDPDELQQFITKIEQDYRVNLILDNLPVVTKYLTEAGAEVESGGESVGDRVVSDDGTILAHYEKGFPLGFVGHSQIPNTDIGTVYINNHLRFRISFHEDSVNYAGIRIVGFEVEAFSVAHELDKEQKLLTCTPSKPVDRSAPPQRLNHFSDGQKKHTIAWTYDFLWVPSPIKWASRWDVYLKMTDSKIHWFSIINSIMIVFFLSAMVAVIMIRILNKDLARYNERDQSTNSIEEELQDETGWKLLHGDVFRPPEYAAWLCTLIGSGVQVFLMTLVTLLFAALGFLSPANRGSLLTGLLLFFVGMAFFSGYTAVRLFKMFKLPESQLKRQIFQTALFFPGVVFVLFFVLNLFVWAERSSGAVPFLTLVTLLILWLGVSVPLTYLGAHWAWRKPAIENPVKVNNLCRLLLPNTNWYSSPLVTILLGGILPFAAVFIEIFFIMSSVWLNQFYYVFGFLFLVFIILLITCAEISIVLCYFQLLNEDYHWWWRAFATSASSALYLFLYSIVYFVTKLQIHQFVPSLLFFGYMLLTAFTFALLTGTIGFIASLLFVRAIYSAIKIE
jgi:transmembrane 9 superfamily protein 2/4